MDRSSSSSEPFLRKKDEEAYSDITTNDEEDAVYLDPKTGPRRRRLFAILSLISKMSILALAVYSLITLAIFAVTSIRKEMLPPCNCGSSIEEALANDCKFDSLTSSWLPPHCRDDELTALFEQSGPGPNGEWPYHATHAETSKKYTVEELAYLADKPDAEKLVWTTVSWHDKHCFFLLLKEMRGKSKMGYTGFSDATAHGVHCVMFMAKHVPQHKIAIGVMPGFGDPRPGENKTVMAK